MIYIYILYSFNIYHIEVKQRISVDIQLIRASRQEQAGFGGGDGKLAATRQEILPGLDTEKQVRVTAFFVLNRENIQHNII